MPRGIRLEFRHFDDGTNTKSWVFKANQFFDFYQTPMNQKLVIAYFHMDGEALVWYQDALDSGQFNGWDTFDKALQTRFGQSTYYASMEALTRLK